ncbi:MAG: hypothetical protein ACYC6M_05005 [Terriglobales bacterium]
MATYEGWKNYGFIAADSEFGFAEVRRHVRKPEALARIVVQTFPDEVEWEDIAKHQIDARK